ncbi:MAG: amino acid ABC transporter substrate-binding protein [Geminicoccaceae bacterium]
MNGFRRFGAGAAALLLFLTTWAVAGPASAAAPAVRPSPAAAPEQKVITLGAVVSLSGRHAQLGRHQTRGYDLAVRRINEQGGVLVGNTHYRLSIEYRDDRSKRSVAQAAARELIEGGVDFMLGGFSSGLINAVAEVTEPSAMPLVQGGGALLSLYNHDRRHLFGVVSTIDKYLTSILSVAIEQARHRGRNPADLTLAIAVVAGAAGNEIKAPVIAQAKRAGIDLIVDQTLPATFDEAEISGLIDRVEAERPDILLVFGYAKATLLTVQELARRKLNVPVVGATHCDGAEVEKLGDAANYILCTSQWDAYANYPDRRFGSSVAFLVDFNLRYGYLPPYQAAQGAATVLTLAEALERAGTLERPRVREALAATNLITMFGPIRFDETGKNDIKPMVVLQIQNGRYKVVWPEAVAWSRAIVPAPVWTDR